MGISLINDLVGGLEPWNFMSFHILGMSSSQLTNKSTNNKYPLVISQFAIENGDLVRGFTH
jgi:hypothetical protein